MNGLFQPPEVSAMNALAQQQGGLPQQPQQQVPSVADAMNASIQQGHSYTGNPQLDKYIHLFIGQL